MIKPLISVITVSYNAVTTIEQTMLSVLNQTYDNVEYIIIDGGSTDGTVDIIKKYADRLAYWVSEPDGGIYDAMNKGIAHATGDLIGIINSDDWYENILDKIAELYLAHDKDCIIHGNIRFITEYSEKIFKPNMNLATSYYKPLFFHPTVFVGRHVYERIGTFNCKYKIAADHDFIVRALLHNVDFIYDDEVIANMRDGGEAARKAIKGFKEVANISINAGLPKLSVYVSLLKKYIMRYLFMHIKRPLCKMKKHK